MTEVWQHQKLYEDVKNPAYDRRCRYDPTRAEGWPKGTLFSVRLECDEDDELAVGRRTATFIDGKYAHNFSDEQLSLVNKHAYRTDESLLTICTELWIDCQTAGTIIKLMAHLIETEVVADLNEAREILSEIWG